MLSLNPTTVKTLNENKQTLITIHSLTNGPKETVEALIARIGYYSSRSLIATMVADKAWDGRISEANKEWGLNNMEVSTVGDPFRASFIAGDTIHVAHLNQIADYMRKAAEPTTKDRYEVRVLEMDEDSTDATEDLEINAYDNAGNAISVASCRILEAAEAGDIIKAIVVDTDTDEVLFADNTLNHRYAVAAYCSEEDSEADTDIIEENSYSTATEAINAAKERIRDAEEDNEAIRVVVYATAYEDEPLYEADSTGTAYRLFEDYATPTLGAVVYSADEAAQALNDWLCDSYEGEEAYKEMLDECNEMVTIGSLSYYPSIALERIDPTAYRCGLVDWADAEYKDALYEIERMEYGDTVSRYGWNCKLVHIAEEIDYTADNSEWDVCR